jgi:small redox-active disulfide protein 2
MKKMQIYGTGCAKCNQLAENAMAAAADAGLEVELEKITAMPNILEAGVMTTPALGIDGQVVSQGKVLKPGQISKLLKA